MPKVYIINTNKANNFRAENDMMTNRKCAAYHSPWKHYIDTIEANDIVYLYSNEIGIIARGIATGIVEVADHLNEKNVEHYMHLNRFQELRIPLPANKVIEILNEATNDEYKIQWNQTMILMAYPLGLKIWQYITNNCI
ncbi:hypothetical protein [Paenibacillus chitinolyticus]|uniref:hypothetical protein n=1 Tax=Paenibacillus chitinolyticus TaxID=79263 RepID=UPI00365BA17D